MTRLLLMLMLVACARRTTPEEELAKEEEEHTHWTLVAPTGTPTPPPNDWFAVHGAQQVFIVGKAGRILQFDGTDLKEVPSPTQETLFGVYAVSDTRAFAVGAHGTVISWNGTAWALEASGTTAELRGVWANERSALAVGANGAAIARAANTWAPVLTDSPDDLFSIANGEFAVGTLGTLARFNGTSFQRQALSGFPKTLYAATKGPGGTFVGGVEGAVFDRSRGNRKVTGLQASSVRGIAAPGENLLFVVGWDGLLARVIGDKVLAYKDAGTTWIEGIWAASSTEVWVVGANGLILKGPPTVDPQ